MWTSICGSKPMFSTLPTCVACSRMAAINSAALCTRHDLLLRGWVCFFTSLNLDWLYWLSQLAECCRSDMLGLPRFGCEEPCSFHPGLLKHLLRGNPAMCKHLTTPRSPCCAKVQASQRQRPPGRKQQLQSSQTCLQIHSEGVILDIQSLGDAAQGGRKTADRWP